jgi:hemolysin activation/secretion protein
MRRLVLSILVLSAMSAQAATPDAGTILQQAQPLKPQEPSPNSTGLTVERAEVGNLPTSAAFDVTSIQLSGNTLFATSELHTLIADGEGKSLTLAQLNQLVERITNFYHQRGFFLSRAYIPKQTIEKGVVRFEVLEARYGKISLDNQSKVNDRLLAATLAPLKNGQSIGQAEMDKSLLQLSDIPGVAFNVTLKPGETVGTSDLNVEAKPSAPYRLDVALDNFGGRVTGRARLGATLNYFEPLAHGDILSVSLLSSGTNLKYGRMSYETLLNGLGTRAGGAYSSVQYVLGDTLANLNGHGTANAYDFWVKHPLVRSPNFNLNARYQYGRKELDDRIDVTSIKTQRRLGNSELSIAGDARDSFLLGGVSTWNLAFTTGNVAFGNAAAQQADSLAAKAEGAFTKWTLNITRLQGLRQSDSIYFNVSSQWAQSNLDSAEKMVVGGVYSVRAYDTGVLSGDSGYSGTVELRHDFRNTLQGQWQAVAFVDSAHVVVNHTPWTTGTNAATLYGAGIGLNWAGPDQMSVKGYIATRLGAKPELVTDTSSVRGWLVVTRAF